MKILPVATLLLLAIFSVASANKYRRSLKTVGVNNNTLYFNHDTPFIRHRRAIPGKCEVKDELDKVVKKRTDEKGQTKYIIDPDEAVRLVDKFLDTKIENQDMLDRAVHRQEQFIKTLKNLIDEKGATVMNKDMTANFLKTFEIDLNKVTIEISHPAPRPGPIFRPRGNSMPSRLGPIDAHVAAPALPPKNPSSSGARAPTYDTHWNPPGIENDPSLERGHINGRQPEALDRQHSNNYEHSRDSPSSFDNMRPGMDLSQSSKLHSWAENHERLASRTNEAHGNKIPPHIAESLHPVVDIHASRPRGRFGR